MNITVDKQPNCIATLSVEIPSDAVKSERDRIVSTYASQARLQGFRPGKAPRKVVEKRFAKEISEELKDRLTRQAYDEAMRKEDLKVLDFGVPANFTESPAGSVSFESSLVLAPDITLPEYKGIPIKAPSAEVTDADIEKNLEQLRERLAEYEDIDDRGAEDGDLVVLDYQSTLDGQPLEEALGKPAGYIAGREGFWMKVDETSFLPGFAAQLLGAKPGDEKEVTVTVPEDFPVAELREKELLFQVSVKELKRVVLPEMDDEFASKVVPDKTLEELKELIRQQTEVEKRRRIDDYKVNQVVEHFGSLIDVDLPEELLRHEIQSQADQMVQRGVQSGMSEEDLEAQKSEIFASAGMQARTNLKTNFILQEVARAENIEVADAELVNHLARIAQSREENPKKFIKQLQREGRISNIRSSMLIGKAIDFILEHATVEEVSEETPDESSDE